MKNFSKLLPALNKKLVLPIVTVIALLLLVGLGTYQVTKAQVTVIQDGEVITVRTHAETVDELLNDLEIEVEEYDSLSHAKDALIQSDMEIKYEKAKQIIVTIDGEDEAYYSTVDTVGDFLTENKLEISEHDELSVGKDKGLEDGLNISIKKAYQVTVNDGGEEKEVWTTGGTVNDLLTSEKIELGDLDRLEPKESDKLSKESTIQITRVEKVTDVVEETIDYSVVTKSDSSLNKGKEKVVSSGAEGLVEKHYEVVLENGEEVSRELVKEEVKKESEERVVAVGTKVIPKTNTSANTGSNTVSRGDSNSSSKTLYMNATAYTANCNGCSGITATGIDLNSNPNAKVIAVDPSVIPLGTRVWVEGYGNAIAGDTGGAINGNKIDLHVASKSEAYSFGSRNVQVKILD
ncbi:G5 and 3D domain-containing protein [Aquibacillus rhizosphaerae]|uniref:Ubiquitin-like domain-containing protein n=1 Tax=Aquibacillus rhizosphaerae TaxID=3051431 RepID=A0ABT7L3A3_9BACI|nr:G5 and 3D domain-containing protein [Aquibacillus sp. LR5S19]MDL4839076.1 ubiquitin-like domain-containing protein [Aquibacillus sp. LR5S19]